MTTTCS